MSTLPFLSRICRDRDQDFKINHGDVIFADRTLQTDPGDLVVEHRNGEYGLRRLGSGPGLSEGIWGVVIVQYISG